MAHPSAGGSVPGAPADPARAYYQWRHSHPSERDDPKAAFLGGYRRGRRDMLDDSIRWVDLVPLLNELLDEAVQLRIEREIEASDRRPIQWAR